MWLLSFQKTIALLIMPVGLLWLGLVVLTLWCAWRRHWGTMLFAATLTLAYAVLGNSHTGNQLLAGLEAQVPRCDPATTAPFDALCVLGGGSELDGAGKPQLGSGGDRIAQAVRWYHAGKARWLVASGVSNDDVAGPRDLAQETKALWLTMGVPESAIITIKEPCWVTRDEIAAYKALQQTRTWTRMAVISSAWHLPRAMALADAAGLAMTPIGADWRGRERAWRLQDLVPSGQGFLAVQLACWEHLGRWIGR